MWPFIDFQKTFESVDRPIEYNVLQNNCIRATLSMLYDLCIVALSHVLKHLKIVVIFQLPSWFKTRLLIKPKLICLIISCILNFKIIIPEECLYTQTQHNFYFNVC